MTDEQIFDRAIELAVGERDRFVKEACGDDSELKERVNALIAAHEQVDNLLDTVAMPPLEDTVTEYPPRKTLGDFEIIRELGRGGMGVVYEARQKSLKRKVALKVLSSGLGLSSKAILRFRREAEAAGKLHHTNIVPIYTTGEDKGIHYYAMELIDGPSLDGVIRELRDGSPHSKSYDGLPSPSGVLESTALEGHRTEGRSGSSPSSVSKSISDSGGGTAYFDQVATMIAEVADALEHAHEHGVIHRDIKPSNLLLAPDGRLSVNDFGLARMLEQPGMTMSGEFVGSPLYMSPEQITAGRVGLDHRTDIYSLGATLYELLTLRPPFAGESRDQVLSQILHKEPASTRKLNRKVPLDLDTICMKAIEKDPDRRYQTAEQLASDLRAYVNRHAISARRIGWIGRSVKAMRRNPVVTTFGFCSTLFLMIGLFAAAAWWAQELADIKSDARDKITTGHLEKAEAVLEKARRLFVDDAWYYRTKGHITLLRGNIDGANEYLDQAEAFGDSSVPLRCLRAIAKFYRGQEQAYFYEADALLKLEDLSIEDHFYLGIVMEWSNPRESLRHLELVERQEARSLAVSMALGIARSTLAMDEPDPRKAVALCEQAIKDLNRCLYDWNDNEKVHATLTQSHLVAAQLHKQLGNASASSKHMRDAKQHSELIPEQTSNSVNVLNKYYYLQYSQGYKAAARLTMRYLREGSRQNNYLAGYAIIDAFRLGDSSAAEEAYEQLKESLPFTNGRQLNKSTKRSFLELARLHDSPSSSDRASRLKEFTEYLDRKQRDGDYSNFEEDWLVLRLLEADPSIARDHVVRSEGFFVNFKNPMQRNLVHLCEYLAEADPDDAAVIARSEEYGSKRLMATAYFGLGARALAEGRRDDARTYFQACIDQHEFHYYVFQWSTALLAKLDEDRDWPSWIPEHQ